MSLGNQSAKAGRSLRWLPAWLWQCLARRPPRQRPVHLIIAIANHFEPENSPGTLGRFADPRERRRRLELWCRDYPTLAAPWRDAEGRPLRQTYFYPAEHYDPTLIARLAEHCAEGWGEIEIHLHHGIEAPDTVDNTRRALLEFRDALAKHGCLSREHGKGRPRYAFVHGNWALANSARGRFCGVDEEIAVLAETGCYADLTLPSAPEPAQVGKINALYECVPPLDRRAAHRRGHDLRCGVLPRNFPLIIQGPLGLNLGRRVAGWPWPGIENGELTASNPPTRQRLALWRRAGIAVGGRPEWVFVKLSCHGMDPVDTPALLGEPMRGFLRDLTEGGGQEDDYRVHFVTAREMTNIILAACEGLGGDPGAYRDHWFRATGSG